MRQINYFKHITGFFILFVFVSIINSCTGSGNKAFEQRTIRPTISTSVKPSSSFSDTISITVSSAVFFKPDSAQLSKIRTIFAKDKFDDMEHQNFYLMKNARLVIERYWPSIHIIETSGHRYLQFVKTDKSTTCIDLDKNGDIWGIFLFDKKKDPELTDMMNIETALNFYFTN